MSKATEGNATERLFAQLIERSIALGEPLDIEQACRDHPEMADDLQAWAKGYQAAAAGLDALVGIGGSDPHGTGSEAHWLGRVIGDFEILREIGRGGMGTVFLARQKSLSRDVALKLLAPHLSLAGQHAERFEREARAVAVLSHPSIATVYSAGHAGDCSYMASQYVEGATLASVVEGLRQARHGEHASDILDRVLRGEGGVATGELNSGQPVFDRDYIVFCCETMSEISDALAYAHGQGVVHRDVKPSNIIILRDHRPVLVDFGLAQIKSEPNLTLTGDILGTPNYMSPEQATGRSSEIDCRTDVYSVGVTLYELLALTPPFEADTPQETITRIVSEQPVAPARRNPRLARDLSTIVMHAIEKRPQDRYQTAGEMRDDLRRFMAFEPIAARPPSSVGQLLRRVRRRPMIAAAAALSVILVAVAVYAARLRIVQHRALMEAEYSRVLDEASALLEISEFPSGNMDNDTSLTKPQRLAARDLFSRALDLQPASVAALLGRARARVGAGVELEYALDDVRKAEEVGGPCTAAQLVESMALAKLGRAEKQAEAEGEHPMIDPASRLDFHLLGVRARLNGDEEEADRLFTRALSIDPQDYWARLWRAETRLLDDGAGAIRDAEICITTRPDLSIAYTWLGLCYEASPTTRDLERAEQLHRQAVGVDPSSVCAAVQLSSILRYRAKPDEALGVLRGLAATNPSSVALSQLGLELVERRQFTEAREVLLQAMATEPVSRFSYVFMLRLLERQGAYDEALPYADSLLEMWPADGVAYLVAGELHRKAGRVEEARAVWQMGIERLSSSDVCRADCYTSLAGSWQWSGEEGRARAEAILREGQNACPDSREVYRAMVRFYASGRQRDIKAAEMTAKEAVGHFPRDSYFAVALAEIARDSGDFDKTILLYRKAARDFPFSSYAHSSLGFFLITYCGADDEAMAEFERAHALEPGDTGLATAYADRLVAAGRVDDALRLLEDLSGKYPGDFRVLASIGRAWAHEGSHKDAEKSLRKAIDLLQEASKGPFDRFDIFRAGTLYDLELLKLDLARELRLMGRYDEAIEMCRGALDGLKGTPAALYRANVLMELRAAFLDKGDKKLADTCFKLAQAELERIKAGSPAREGADIVNDPIPDREPKD